MAEKVEFYRETEFKDTEIGRIPKEWEVVNLGSIAKISSGNTAPQEEKYFKNGKYPFIRVQHLKELQEEKFPVNYDFVNDYALSELKLKLFKKGCIVFPKSGESIKLEKRAMLKEDSCVVNHLAVIEPLYENIDNLFLFYYLCTIKTSNYLTETTMPSLNLSTISNFLVPLPSLIEQQRIAEILSNIDGAIQITDDIIDKTESLKKGLMQELLMKGIGHKEFKDTEIGRIPKDWEYISAADIADYINGYPFSPKDWKMYGIPIIRIQNLNDPNAEFNFFNGEIDDIYKIKNGDLLFSWSASIGIYIWKRGDAVLNQHIFKVIPKTNINKLFLYYDLLLAIEQLKGRVHGSTMKHFQKNELKTTFIPIPSIKEQQKIAEILSTVDKKLEVLKQEKVKFEKIKQWFMEKLLTGRIRVRIA